jgi:predicted 3-demethylubiquinone-9 3-methyltransferase (glyoxalase superfamily)
MKKLSPCLWFDNQAEEAANFYVSVFKDATLGNVTRFPAVGQEIHGGAAGSVMTVDFTIGDITFTALNGGPLFKFTEAISFQIPCKDQEEIDYYWEKLKEGGPVESQQCGWLKDKFGVSWQVVPENMNELMGGTDPEKNKKAMAVMLQMHKLVIAELEAAANS